MRQLVGHTGHSLNVFRREEVAETEPVSRRWPPFTSVGTPGNRHPYHEQ